ncbi:MAG TPA: hypothetical protein VIF83_13945, partial [Gemmatimonadaceae bacterium]
EEGLATARAGVERSNHHAMFVYVLGTCRALAGQMDEAREVFEPILGELEPLYVATVHAALGDESAALDTLERAAEARSDWMYSVGTQPWFRAYHSHPRFVALLERLHLPPVATMLKKRRSTS